MLWPTFKYFDFSKMKRKKDKGFADSSKNTEHMFGGLFLLNIVEKKKGKKKKEKKKEKKSSKDLVEPKWNPFY